MNSFQLKYHKCRVLIAAFIGVPLIGALTMLTILFCLPIDTPIWTITVLILSFLSLMILTLRWVIKTQIFVACDVNIYKSGIRFIIKNDSLFYTKRNLFFTWKNITSIEEKFNNQNGDYYYAIRFNEPSFSANFSMKEQHEEEAEAFFKQLRYFQDNQYQEIHHLSKPFKIGRKNILATS